MFKSNKSKLTILMAALAAMILMTACEENHEASARSRQKEMIARGEYLVMVGGCNDCHTPFKMGENGPEPDMTRMLSGHPASLQIVTMPELQSPEWTWAGAATNTAFAGPWGITFAANLTPDRETGMGIWTEEMFIQTLRTGKHWGVDRPILPPMPWQNYARMTDDDLQAMFAYLQSIPPYTNPVPLMIPPKVAGR